MIWINSENAPVEHRVTEENTNKQDEKNTKM